MRNMNLNQDHQRNQLSDARRNKKKEIEEGKQEVYPESRLLSKQNVDNPAAALVTQVPQGASKPVVDPTETKHMEFNQDHIVVGPSAKPGKKCLVLDLDETLVHSSFQPVENCDLVLPVEIDNQVCYVYVLKRPGVDIFLEKLAHHYEIIIYTASLSKYANPLLDWLDPKGLCSYRLFREHCTYHKNVFVKDLSRLSRPLKDTIIIDNSPASYMFHPECAIPTTSWYDDPACTELYQFIPILECLSKVKDVRPFLKAFVKDNRVMFAKASQVLRGGKIGGRAQSQPHFKPKEEKYSDSNKKERKNKRSSYKKRNASERRSHKTSGTSYRPSTYDTETYSTQKYHSKYSLKSDSKESYSAKHTSPKFDKHTPKQNKYYSKFEDTSYKYKSKNLNTSKFSGSERQSERNSSRKKDRGDRTKYRGSRKNSKSKYGSMRRQNSANDLEPRTRERGNSAHVRPQSAKEPSLKSDYSKQMGKASCNYKNPEEFHKLRYSLASKKEKVRRPSSAKRKDTNPLKDSKSDMKSTQEFNFTSQLKSYNCEKNSFLDSVANKETTQKNPRSGESRYSQYEMTKNKIYESRKNSNRESRKRSSSKDRTKEYSKGKYSESYGKQRSSRSRSHRHSGRSTNRSTDKHSEKHLSKTRSSAALTQPTKSSFHNTASLKFNNILKDMGAHCGVGGSSQFFNYPEKVKKRSTNEKKKPKLTCDKDKYSSRYSTNLEASLKSKESNILKTNEIYRMNANNNHHYHYMYSANTGKTGGEENAVGSKTITCSNNDSSNLDTSLKGQNPVISISSINTEGKAQKQSLKKSSRGKKIQDPAIPFPQSQKHYSSKLAASEVDFVAKSSRHKYNFERKESSKENNYEYY